MKHYLALLAVALLARPAAAQIDYRNLDRGRPGAVEDAYPIERYAFDLAGGVRYVGLGRSGSQQVLESGLAYGVAPGWSAGIGAPFAVTHQGGATASGLGGLRFFALSNITTERPGLPGLAWRFDGLLPVGSKSGSGMASMLQLLATRSFGRSRVHLNLGFGLQRPVAPAEVESIPRWSAGAAVDRTLFRSSTLLVAELSAAREARGTSTGITPGIGIRRQMTPTLVLDAGLSYRVAKAEPARPAVSLGLTHAFAIAGLIPGVGR